MELDFYNFALCFVRLGAFLYVLPFFSATNFPHTLRIALGLLTAMLLAPTLPPVAVGQASVFGLLGMLAQEVSIGLLLGFVARMVFYAADLAGGIIATEIGLNMGTIMNPLNRSASPIPGTILFFLAAVVMLTLDLHHWILAGFQQTYLVLPVGGAHLNETLFRTVLTSTSRIFVVGLQITAPVMAVSFVVTLVFAVLSRAVPQMNVFILSFSFRIVGGLAVFGFTLHLTAQHVMNYLRRLPEDLMGLAQILGAG
ncbi:MAG TPA: flagellar biosynthetic protein FliR [Verrucomicrobiae bacterium]